ncbi:unnamed protein product [Pedinophyceae sp. YPF-701]|nr:unnamed protein product [Pedinophyceae sp. YPF-701]
MQHSSSQYEHWRQFQNSAGEHSAPLPPRPPPAPVQRATSRHTAPETRPLTHDARTASQTTYGGSSYARPRPSGTETEAPMVDSRYDQDAVTFTDVFSLRRPKHLGSGLVSGTKSLLKGTAAGAVALVAAPVLGAQQDGFVGALKGATVGICGAVLLPVTGATVGIIQTVRGVINTPVAIHNHCKGRFWDPIEREWTDDDPRLRLVPEPEPRAGRASARSVAGAPVGRGARDDPKGYYKALGLTHSATAEEVKREYYLRARRCHPDKHPDDPTAHEAFQHLAEAYQVLTDSKRRREYDTTGAADVEFIEPSEFFTALFGLDELDELVGELTVAAVTRLQAEADGGRPSDHAIAAYRQNRRTRLIIALQERIQKWRTIGPDGDAARAELTEQAEAFAALQNSDYTLLIVGQVYLVEGERGLGGWDGFVAGVRSWGAGVGSQWRAAKAAFRVLQKQRELDRWEAEQDRIERREARDAIAKAAADEAAGLRDGRYDPVRTAAAAPSVATTPERPGPNKAVSMKQPSQVPGVWAPEPSAKRGLRSPRKIRDGPKDTYLGAEGQDSKGQRVGPEAWAREAHRSWHRQREEEDSLPLVLDALWAATEVDIRQVVGEACRAVLADVPREAFSGVERREIRREMARAMMELGQLAWKAEMGRVEDPPEERWY